ncbi:hypothetical protein SAMN05421736_12318 [Evansella caseinilytica]|uniref:Haloacid dehalogenase n=1 Tax=Evansella caseinilytica TaxID=1503961 RepID=A0A1H3ULH6_9BACI|nr:Cof-type HAD-IIB family hydrolase [Evansella caseinilytica]SDZ63280.1 hypothetical protein SAMN05421736_12318 [Evansella caseinilytica]
MRYKMIVLDMDDTLLHDDHTISERAKTALMNAQKQGVKVVLASGRPLFGMRTHAKELQLDEYGSYIVAFNGAQIIDCKTEDVLFTSHLEPDTVHRLADLSRREGVFLHTFVGDTIVTEQTNPYTALESKLTGIPVEVVDSIKEKVTRPVVKVLMSEEPEKLIEVERNMKAEFNGTLSIFRSKPFFLEFIEPGVTKGSSLSKLIDKLGISREEVIAVGDSYNDLEMIQFAGFGVAMANAPDDIKAKADHVTASNIDDGVAIVVEKFVLQEQNRVRQ